MSLSRRNLRRERDIRKTSGKGLENVFFFIFILQSKFLHGVPFVRGKMPNYQFFVNVGLAQQAFLPL